QPGPHGAVMLARIEAVVRRFRSHGVYALEVLLVVVLPVFLLGDSVVATVEASDSVWIAVIYDAADHDEVVRNLLGASLLTSSDSMTDPFPLLVGVVPTLATAGVDAGASSALPSRSPPHF